MIYLEILFCVGFIVANVVAIVAGCYIIASYVMRKRAEKCLRDMRVELQSTPLPIRMNSFNGGKTALLTDCILGAEFEKWENEKNIHSEFLKERGNRILPGFSLERDENFRSGRCRAKRWDNGEWCVGFCIGACRDRVFFRNFEGHGDLNCIEVDPNTFCVYTGWKLNGEAIFTGDVLRKHTEEFGYFVGVVQNFSWTSSFDFQLYDMRNDYYDRSRSLESEHVYQDAPNTQPCKLKCSYELLGNVFDNPEYNVLLRLKEGEA